MVRTPENPDRVRLAPADWGGLCSLALASLTLAGATLYKVHEVAQTNRERLAAVDAELAGLKQSVSLLQSDVRVIARRPFP
ncbi:hypothetical protein MalM25_34350 [Planctomycetes bacterium MalM25]|nr:hypothetical protein MalM25_34350 [Planctomycetes bacterium MalM25]